MFCLRSWLPILFFLTNASPVYLILFVSATYFLNRPCVYCSLLLGILVVSLYDFHGNWFEPRYASPIPEEPVSNMASMLPDAVASAISAVTASANGTISAALDTAATAVKSRVGGEHAVHSTLVEWMKGILRKEWKIECLDLIVRL